MTDMPTGRHAIALLWAVAAAWRSNQGSPWLAWHVAVTVGDELGIAVFDENKPASLLALRALRQALGVDDIFAAPPRTDMLHVIAQAIALVKAGDVDQSEGKDGTT